MPDYAEQRFNMVESQVRSDDVTDVRIQSAMREVQRELFVPEDKRALAYADAVVPLLGGRFLLDPRTFAKLAQLARIAPSDRVLDVGCATGYSTAVLAQIAGRVIGLEEDAGLVRIAQASLRAAGISAAVIEGALAKGHAAGAPYDVIFINGAVESDPKDLLDHLAEDGRLVTVVRNGSRSRAHVFVREKDHVGSRPAFDAYVPVLAGFIRTRTFLF